MKLYRPVLIGSAEQAEALPIGTVALDHPRGTRDELIPYVKATPDRWASVWDVSALGNIKSYGTAPNEAMVGDRALVPIEAVDHHRVVWAEPDPHITGPMPLDDAREIVSQREPWEPEVHIESRLATPWEEA